MGEQNGYISEHTVWIFVSLICSQGRDIEENYSICPKEGELPYYISKLSMPHGWPRRGGGGPGGIGKAEIDWYENESET